MSIAGAGAAAAAGIGAAGGAINFMSNIRSATLPRAGEVVGDGLQAVAMLTDAFSGDDWRVRLSLPSWPSFRGSPVLKPLKDAGGMIFPYTPSIQLSNSASYSAMTPVHSNFKFNTYQHSDPGTISITAPMNVEDNAQALYWIAALHYFRAMTKMFSGNDPKAGNPPPIVQLNGYGSYVFNNVPVVVTSFSTNLTAECDYIPVQTNTSIAGAVASAAGGIGSIAGAIGGAFGVSKVTDKITDITDGISSVATMANSLGFGGSMGGGTAYVPTKSTFIVNLTPMYSRTSARKFSLDNFVAGGYLNNSFGYV
jgi:hypothetical protein